MGALWRSTAGSCSSGQVECSARAALRLAFRHDLRRVLRLQSLEPSFLAWFLGLSGRAKPRVKRGAGRRRSRLAGIDKNPAQP